jgi:hypothetical protein
MQMHLAIGVVLIAVTIAMVAVARPKNGISAPYLKVWIVGQVYALTALVSAVAGIGLVLSEFFHL